MKQPSTLGAAIEEVIENDIRFTCHRKAIQYMCCYRTNTNTVFAFERITQNQINFWLPDVRFLKETAAANGCPVEPSEPFNYKSGTKQYGRISSLQSIPELSGEKLLKIQVTSPSKALSILSVLP